MSVKSAETFDQGESIGAEWIGRTPEERALAIASWIRKAAKYSRHPRIRLIPAQEAHRRTCEEHRPQ